MPAGTVFRTRWMQAVSCRLVRYSLGTLANLQGAISGILTGASWSFLLRVLPRRRRDLRGIGAPEVERRHKGSVVTLQQNRVCVGHEPVPGR